VSLTRLITKKKTDYIVQLHLIFQLKVVYVSNAVLTEELLYVS